MQQWKSDIGGGPVDFGITAGQHRPATGTEDVESMPALLSIKKKQKNGDERADEKAAEDEPEKNEPAALEAFMTSAIVRG